jgi:UDP-N-acetylmuramoylalanine--D-glutamate ligase
VRVGGNIGAGVLGLEPLHAGAIYVLELSSYQLDLTDSLRLNVAVHLNLTPDHLDRHGGMDGYAAAKKRIFANQGAGDWAVIGVDDEHGLTLQAELRSSAREVAAISARQALSHGVAILGDDLYDILGGRAEPVFPVAEARALPGRHNGQNMAAAYAACRALGLSPAGIRDGLRSFPGLRHRLEMVCTLDGVRFVNDSKATNADAAAQALAVYPTIYWIAGGRAKEGGIASLKPFFPRIARAYLIGECADGFAKTLSGHVPVASCQTMDRAVEAAFADARADKAREPVVLLSPAAASFDQYPDFEARGDAFKALALTINPQAERKAVS